MKRISLLFATLFVLILSGCQQQGSTGQENTSASAEPASLEAWDAVKEEYHHLMAFTFHPAEEGDLNPIKKDHAAMAEKAKEFAMLGIPKEQEGKGLDELVKKLQADSEGLSNLISKGATDEEIKTALFALHDVYHRIEEVSMQ